VDENEWLAGQFEAHRSDLRAVAYRMLGSVTEADDAVQESWIRLSRSDSSDVRNLGGWLTTVVSRVCLDHLRSRKARREEPLDVHVPEPILGRLDGADEAADPERQALLADSVGLALLVVLETLAPAERLAFVLHDMFAVPFEDIAPIVDRSPDAAKMLASRARRRLRSSAALPDADRARQRAVVEAFMAASRAGDFEALVEVLDPDVVLRVDFGPLPSGPTSLRGARTVASQALTYQRYAAFARPVLINGQVGLLTAPDGKPFSLMGFTIARGKVVALDILADPERLARLDLTVLSD
jgi:RNA polymerase sigma factor (sigma-70 family)